MADFINVGFGNMVNGDKIISMVSTDAAPKATRKNSCFP